MQYLKLKHIYPVKKSNSTIINLLLPYHFLLPNLSNSNLKRNCSYFL